MKLSISNIGWSIDDDKIIYRLMQIYGFTGLEIAPTRVFPQKPYDNIETARKWVEQLKKEFGFSIPSMQSIWYGRSESIFGSSEERAMLFEYTKKAIDFACAIDCKNLVFGCPKNRNKPNGADEENAVEFFRDIGKYAVENGTVIGMEANPPIYNTNYINDTLSALELIKEVNSPGFMLNLDLGTMIYNEENIFELQGYVHLINHVHISEPYLKPICERVLHRELIDMLFSEGYNKFVSVEMGNGNGINVIDNVLNYVKKLIRIK